MRNPIKFALYEGKIPFATQTFSSLEELKGLHFHEFNPDRYPLVALAGTVLTKKGTYGAVLNRSNEVAVAHFLKGDISFLDIERIVIKCMNEHKNISHPSLAQIIEVDHKINEKAELLVKQIMKGEQI